jgi:sec-independent protein translocase protein TatB
MFPEGRALEFLIAGVIALIVVGPKDLPVLMRKLGQFTGKLRAMAAEFRSAFDEMARQSELDELRKEVEAMRKAQQADVAAAAGAAQAEFQESVADIGRSFSGLREDIAPPAEPAPYHEAPSEPAAPAPKPRAKRAATPRKKAAPKSPEPGS